MDPAHPAPAAQVPQALVLRPLLVLRVPPARAVDATITADAPVQCKSGQMLNFLGCLYFTVGVVIKGKTFSFSYSAGLKHRKEGRIKRGGNGVRAQNRLKFTWGG